MTIGTEFKSAISCSFNGAQSGSGWNSETSSLISLERKRERWGRRGLEFRNGLAVASL